MLPELNGLLGALRAIRDCTSRSDSGGCEDCQDAARSALLAWEKREPLRDVAHAISSEVYAGSGLLGCSWQGGESHSWACDAILDAIDEHVLGAK